ncbi:hypothetical protein Dda_3089 [Drechslerella dactyloides]|uniref:Aminotransferase class I/classII large domain-containing protein n=1 Tax=Drechslerella dactyloides TaxID=74499 RepID=A0AAD6NL52_DREDA|nr:hypothetical protein Dda_3089 [Drechslerella dactyloides]
MVYIKPFDVEEWMNDHETQCRYNIAETCCDSLSLADLASLSTDATPNSNANPLAGMLHKRLDYGAIRGSTALRSAIATLYSPPLHPDNILITPGAIAANLLVFYALVGPGDHVIVLHPTYQQLHAVPASLGAEVSLWPLRRTTSAAGGAWTANVRDLAALIKRNTRMIVVNTPNNPTGAVLPASVIRRVLELARERGIVVLGDEVYSPIFHTPDVVVPSILSLAGALPPASPTATSASASALQPGGASARMEEVNVIVTGSLSKAYALAGIRIGWIASRTPNLLSRTASARDYTTISVSQLDDAVAAFALSPAVRPSLLARNVTLAATNARILDAFIGRCSRWISYVKPLAGTTAFVQVRNSAGEPVDDVAFCETVLRDVGVLVVPGGRCFGVAEGEFRGYVRVGFACDRKVLEEGLAAVAAWIEKGGVDAL